jgi:ABC-type sugar transport system permease subunit
MALTTAKEGQKGLGGLLGLNRGRDAAQKRFVAGAVTPLVLYMAFFTLLPLVWGFALAFFEYSARRSGGPILELGGDNPFVGLQNFQAMALPLAVLIESVHKRLRGIFRTIFFLPVLAPAVGVAIMWGYVFHPQRGLLNGIRTLIGGKYVATAWLRDPSLTFLGVPVALFAVIVAYLWQDLGYNLVIFIAALQSIPQSIKDAARIDGVNRWQMFWRITIPLLRPTILLAAILTMISSFQVFDIIQVMTEGGPSDQTQVLVLNIYDYAFRFQRMGWAAAVSVVLFLMVFSFSIIQNRLIQTDWEY